MKKDLTIMLLATVLLGLVLLGLSCGYNSGNNGVQQPNNNAATDLVSSDPDSSCTDDPDANTVKTAIGNKIKGLKNSQLPDLYRDGHFSIDMVKIADGSLNMTISGTIGDFHSSDHKKDFDSFADMAKVVTNFTRKRCVSKITFLPAGSTLRPGGGGDGFIWYACEDGTHPCNGACVPDGTSCIIGNANANSDQKNRPAPNTDTRQANTKPGQRNR